MSSILKGIVDENENVLVLYIDGKPAAKYTNKYEAEKDVEHMRGRMPHRNFELKQEVHETKLDENLHKWFKEKWVRFGPDGKIRGACARGSDKEGKPKCLPQKKAQALGKKGRKYAASKKRREDPNPERRGPAKNVATKKKTNEGIPFNVCPECGNEIVHESMMNEKKDACYHKVKARYKVWPSAYASGALVQCRKKGASNWGTGGKKNENNIMKGLVDEAGSPAQQAAIAINMKKHHKKPKNIDEGVIVGHDANDPDVAIIGGAGTYKLSNVKKKAQMEANELAKDVMNGKFKNSAINVRQLANTLNTIVAAEDEMEKGYFGEDYTGEFAAEVTPAINPYGGLKDKKVRGAIGEALLSEMPDTSGAVGVQPGGWRTYSPKLAGQLDEAKDETYVIKDLLDKVSSYHKKPNAQKSAAIRLWNALLNAQRDGDEVISRRELARTPNVGRKALELIDLLYDVKRNSPMSPYYYIDLSSELADEFKAAISKMDYEEADRILHQLRTTMTNIKKKNISNEDTAYAGGMNQGGNAGQSYRKFTPKSAGTFKEDELDEACWKGYHKEGNKKMFGKTYPNCVKNTNEEEKLDEKCWDSHKQVGMKKKGDKMVPNCVPKESAIMKGLTGKRR